MIIYFNKTNNITKKYNLNFLIFFNDTNNNFYYKKKLLFKGMIEIMKNKYKTRKKLDICVCYTFILIFKFILIYLLHMLFILKIDEIFRKRKSQPEKTKRGSFLYI